VRGHFVIEGKEGTKKGTGGVRIVPMSETARDAVLEYLRRERPATAAAMRPVLKEVNWSPAASRSSSPTTGTPSVRAAGT